MEEVFKKTPQLVTENTKTASQHSECQSTKFVSASDELGKSFFKLVEIKNFFEVTRDPEVNFL